MEKVPENIWYLAGPMFQYNEDVKALARQAGLKIIDANVAVGRANAAADVPEVTIKAEYAEQAIYASGERVPTMAELLAERDELQAQKGVLLELEHGLRQLKEDLGEREQALATREAAVADQAQANEVEALRLRDETARLQAANDAAAATAPPPAATLASTEKSAKAAKA